MNVVFTCNTIHEADRTLKIYYGAADTNIGLAEGNINEIVDLCFENSG